MFMSRPIPDQLTTGMPVKTFPLRVFTLEYVETATCASHGLAGPGAGSGGVQVSGAANASLPRVDVNRNTANLASVTAPRPTPPDRASLQDVRRRGPRSARRVVTLQ